MEDTQIILIEFVNNVIFLALLAMDLKPQNVYLAPLEKYLLLELVPILVEIKSILTPTIFVKAVPQNAPIALL
jgi:hypothetical protein